MQKKNVGIYFRRVFPCLALAAVLTMPPAVTWSKYVWQEDINVTLVVNYSEQSITSLLPDGNPSEFWVQDLTNIRATATADGLILTAETGYTLPESITVKVGSQTYSVRTDGTDAPAGISFAPGAGLLSIAESLIDENPGGVTVSAVAVQEPSPDEGAVSGDGTDEADGADEADGTSEADGTNETGGTSEVNGTSESDGTNEPDGANKPDSDGDPAVNGTAQTDLTNTSAEN